MRLLLCRLIASNDADLITSTKIIKLLQHIWSKENVKPVEKRSICSNSGSLIGQFWAFDYEISSLRVHILLQKDDSDALIIGPSSQSEIFSLAPCESQAIVPDMFVIETKSFNMLLLHSSRNRQNLIRKTLAIPNHRLLTFPKLMIYILFVPMKLIFSSETNPVGATKNVTFVSLLMLL